jgi:hypothetical protein
MFFRHPIAGSKSLAIVAFSEMVIYISLMKQKRWYIAAQTEFKSWFLFLHRNKKKF